MYISLRVKTINIKKISQQYYVIICWCHLNEVRQGYFMMIIRFDTLSRKNNINLVISIYRLEISQGRTV